MHQKKSDMLALKEWFLRHRRDLPWRHQPTPYRVWVSEVMLQQTQVSVVLPYFERWMTRFPSIGSLADASEEQVIKVWEGLGYYRRARHLHQAAQRVVQQFDGNFPSDVQSVRSLPGIGRYTAGAILSIAHNARLPILEANTLRLYSRLLAFRSDPRSAAGQSQLWKAAESWLPRKQVGQFNQALMELGSLICTPQAPRCSECPVSTLCQANQLGLQHEIPPPAKKQTFEDVHEAALIVHRRSRVLLLRQQDQGRWAGLWDFPRYRLSTTGEAAHRHELSQAIISSIGMEISLGPLLTTLKHGVTRFRITLDCYSAQWISGPDACPIKGSLKWVDPAQLSEYPLNSTGRKLCQWIG